MREYDQPLAVRLQKASYKAKRYRTDPKFRMHKINQARMRDGRPTITSLDEVRLRVPLTPKAGSDA